MAQNILNIKRISLLEKTEPPVQVAMVMVCEKCGSKLATDPDKNPSQTLKKELKHKIKETYGKGVVRATTTSCMDLCPKDRVAVAFVCMDSAPEFFLAEGKDPDADAGALFEKLETAIRRRKI